MILEYVSSGLSHLAVNNSSIYNYPDDAVNKIIIGHHVDCINLIKQYTSHDYSLLFNAFQEEKLGRDITCSMRKYVKNVYSDSGGLQIVTRGMTADQAMKQTIYKIQSDYSTKAMIFDEIPVVLRGERSLRTDVGNRLYDPSILEAKARETGENLRDQIDFFIQEKTVSKPMLILQGNCLESYQKWVDVIMDVIGPSRYQYIGGISSGSAALGQGILEDVKRYFYFAQIKYPEEVDRQHLHILGVGAITRLMPLVPLIKAGLFPKDIQISYDSTTHTANISSGQYYKNFKVLDLGRQRNPKYFEVLSDMNRRLLENDLPLVEDDLMFLYLCQRSKATYHKNLNDQQKIEKYLVYNSFFYCQLINFMLDLEKLFANEAEFDAYAHGKKLYLPFNALKHCRDANDFEQWEHQFLPKLKSKTVQSVEQQSPTLDQFF